MPLLLDQDFADLGVFIYRLTTNFTPLQHDLLAFELKTTKRTQAAIMAQHKLNRDTYEAERQDMLNALRYELRDIGIDKLADITLPEHKDKNTYLTVAAAPSDE